MTVTTPAGDWVIPPERAVWIPSGVVHSILVSGPVAMRTLYFRTGLVRTFPECTVLGVSPLLRELVLHVCHLGVLRTLVPAHRRLLGVLLDQLRSVSVMPLQLRFPCDPRARVLAQALLDSPDERRPLAALCAGAGASKRTIERLFREQTGMSAGRWRQQVRLLAAMRHMAGGRKVAAAAFHAGYRSPSAFIAMFRRALGTTPAHYFREGPSPMAAAPSRGRRRAAGTKTRNRARAGPVRPAGARRTQDRRRR